MQCSFTSQRSNSLAIFERDVQPALTPHQKKTWVSSSVSNETHLGLSALGHQRVKSSHAYLGASRKPEPQVLLESRLQLIFERLKRGEKMIIEGLSDLYKQEYFEVIRPGSTIIPITSLELKNRMNPYPLLHGEALVSFRRENFTREDDDASKFSKYAKYINPSLADQQIAALWQERLNISEKAARVMIDMQAIYNTALNLPDPLLEGIYLMATAHRLGVNPNTVPSDEEDLEIIGLVQGWKSFMEIA